MTQKPGKTFLYKKKLECVIVCVNYGDFLSVTLPYNRDNFDRIVIVTSREDVETLNVATSCDAEVVTTDVYRDNNSLFNKGKMINIGLNRLDKDGWILITDADVLFRKNLKNRIFSRILNIDSLYYAIRLHTPEYNREKWIHEFLKDESIISSLHFKSPGDNKMPWGYFQLFNIHSKFLVHTHRTHIYPENFPSAGEVDYQFQSMWDDEYKVLLPEVIIHIAHGKLGENWSGRKTPKFYISEA